ncbi:MULTISPECIES: hypothetical protein [Halomonadaceae]|uniref:hypothetical protein n=1 Tax=Halomonadaceae TaxID=28256 RepID=UPI00159B523A|nr:MULTISPECIES: hypothetical protein [Halomonas]QJQ96720.1 hypothetical protein HIO72_16495 [Halomonas sp. PA5]
MTSLNRQRLKLAALIALFAAPMLAAWAMVEWRVGIPEQRLAHGELQPDIPPLAEWPLAEPPVQETGDWLMVFDCSVPCDAHADQWWRLHRALGREAPRISRLRIDADEEASKETLPGESNALWSARPAWLDAGQLWVFDPHGQPVLSYAANTDPRDILRDIGRLLKMNPDSRAN